MFTTVDHFSEEASRNKNTIQDINFFDLICCNRPKYRKFKIDGLVPNSEYLTLAKVTPTWGFLQGFTVLNRIEKARTFVGRCIQLFSYQ